MFAALRSKLVVSHVVVVALAFFLTVGIASVPIRRAQEARSRASLALSAESVSRQIDLARQLSLRNDAIQDSTTIEFAQRLADNEHRRSANRILLIDDSGTVIVDSDAVRSMVGESLPQIADAVIDISTQIRSSQPVSRPGGRVALALDTRSLRAGTIDGRTAVVAGSAASATRDIDGFYAVAIAPHATPPVFDDVIRPLTIAAIIGLGASVVIALLIARTVTGPLRELTQSASRISPGDLNERVTIEAGGEIGTLVVAFNRMLDRIATTYQSQRDLLANIAHELRTPLTSIQGYSHALRDNVLKNDQERDGALVVISDEAARMTVLVEQILQLARLESRQLSLDLRATNLGDIFEVIQNQFTPLARERGVQLQIETTNVEVTADSELLIQAIGNITSNAIRHTPVDGRVAVRASRVIRARQPPRIRIVISDSGEGIDEEHLNRVFERFYRAGDKAREDASSSYGLGLSIVREIVERHGGEINVESAPGTGAMFSLEFPESPEVSETRTG